MAVNRVLGNQLSRMNDRLIGAIDGLVRASLPEAWQRARDQIRMSAAELDQAMQERFDRLVKEIEAVGASIETLRRLRDDHERWQRLDNELRAELAQFEAGGAPQRFKSAWEKRLGRRTRELCVGGDPAWANALIDQAGKLDHSLAQLSSGPVDTTEVSYLLFELRGYANQRFNQVDTDLKRECGRLRDLRPLLEAALDQLP
jgi:hypothetical protein